MKKTVSILLALLLVFSTTAFGLTAAAEGETPEIVDSGYCGGGDNIEDVWYTLDSDGELTIGGTGKICDLFFHWSYYAYAQQVLSIVILNGITEIGAQTFDGCYRACTVTIPASVTRIGFRAFYEDQPHVVVYRGTPEQWNQMSKSEDCGVFDGYYNYLNEHAITSQTMTVASAATCIRKGYEKYCFVCSKCGELYDEFYEKTLPVDPDNHVHTTSFPATEATETEHGYTAGVYCDDCKTWVSGHEVVHTPAAAVHENETAATCTEAGGYDEVVYCTKCDYAFSRNHIDVPAPGHAWGEWVVVKQATTDEEGLMRRTCQNDPTHVEEQVIPKLKPNTTVFQQFMEMIKTFFENLTEWIRRLFRW